MEEVSVEELDDFTPELDVPFRLGGKIVEVYHEECAEDPRDWDDAYPPGLYVYFDRGDVMVDDKHGGDEVLAPLDVKSKTWVYENRLRILDALDMSEKEARPWVADYVGGSVGRWDYRLAWKEALTDLIAERRNSELPEALAAIWELAGYQARSFVSRGYCQGDEMYGVMVETDSYMKKLECGPCDNFERLTDGLIKELSHWAWGDVYGVSVEAPHEDLNCAGFYGWESMKQYLKEEVAKG